MHLCYVFAAYLMIQDLFLVSPVSAAPYDIKILSKNHSNYFRMLQKERDKMNEAKSKKEIPSTYHYEFAGPREAYYDCTIPFADNALDNVEEAQKDIRREVGEYLSNLKGECLVRLDGWWRYEYCHGENVRQFHPDPKTDEPVLNADFYLGSSLEGNGEMVESDKGGKISLSSYYKMNYIEGTECDLNGKLREAEVRIFCRPRVKNAEPISCQYIVSIHSSKLCEHPFFESSSKAEKGELVICFEKPLPNEEELEAGIALEIKRAAVAEKEKAEQERKKQEEESRKKQEKIRQRGNKNKNFEVKDVSKGKDYSPRKAKKASKRRGTASQNIHWVDDETERERLKNGNEESFKKSNGETLEAIEIEQDAESLAEIIDSLPNHVLEKLKDVVPDTESIASLSDSEIDSLQVKLSDTLREAFKARGKEKNEKISIKVLSVTKQQNSLDDEEDEEDHLEL